MSHQEWFETAKAEILAQPNAPSAELVDAVGSIYNQICHGIAAGADAVEWLARTLVDGLFLDTAAGDALSRLGADRYGVVRSGTSSAVVTLSVSRPTAAFGAITLSAGTVVYTADGIRFETVQSLSFGGAATGPGLVTAVAVTPGLVGNVAAGTLTNWEEPPADASLVVTNPERASGGNEEEPDEEYRSRVRAAFLASRRATLEAIRQGALTVATVREASTFEVLDPAGRPAGAVVMTIGDEEGNANSQMVTDVVNALVEYRPAGVGVFPQVGTPRYEQVRLRATWRPGQATDANALAVRQVVIGRVNRLDPRAAPAGSACEAAAKLTVGMIQSAARSVAGVVDVEVLLPVGTVEPSSGEVIRTRLDLVEVVP